MKKIFLCVALFLASFFVANTAKAQLAFGGNGIAALPLGSFKEFATPGFGAGLGGHYFINPNFSAGVNISYISFGFKDTPTVRIDGSNTILGFAGSANYYFSEEIFRPYIGIDVGYSMFIASIKGNGITVSASKGYVGLAPTVGFLYEVSYKLALNVNLKYAILFSDPNLILNPEAAYVPLNVGMLYTMRRRR